MSMREVRGRGSLCAPGQDNFQFNIVTVSTLCRLTMVSFLSVFLLFRDRLCGGVVIVASFLGETAFQGDSADQIFWSLRHFNTLQRRDYLVASASVGARGELASQASGGSFHKKMGVAETIDYITAC